MNPIDSSDIPVPNTGDGGKPEGIGKPLETGEKPIPSAEPADGGSNITVEQWNAEKQQLIQQHEENINRLKSTLQSGAAQRENELRAQLRETQRLLNETKLQSLPEEERANFLAQMQTQEYQQIVEENNNLKRQLSEQKQMQNYIQYYKKEFGITDAELDVSGGLTTVYQSGQKAIAKRLKDLEGKASSPPPPPASATSAPKPGAPPVAANTSGVPIQSPTIDQIVKEKYGGDEEAYWRAVESKRQTPPTV